MTAPIIRAARVAALRFFIDKLNEFMTIEHEYEPPARYRIEHLSDEDYCEDCANKEADRLYFDTDHYRDPSIVPGFELDDPCHCSVCGVVLSYSLMPIAAVAQIHSFIDEDRGFRGALLPEEAYQVHQILMALHDLARFGTDDMIDEVWSGDYRNAVSLGEMAIAAIHLDPEQLDLFSGGPDGQETDVAGSECSGGPADGPG